MKHTRILALAALLAATTAQAADLKLWYDKPAVDWESESLPIGNGRLGAMVFGAVEREHIQFNEDSLWIGDESDTGSYQAFGDLFIDLKSSGVVSDYRRELDIGRGVHTITYTREGRDGVNHSNYARTRVTYRREYFASHAAGVMVFRFSTDKPGALTGSITMEDAHQGLATASGNGLTIKGNLAGFVHHLSKDRKNYDIALDYEAQALVRNEGGSLEARNGRLEFKNVDSLTIYLDAGTDYVNRRESKWRGEHPHNAITTRLEKAFAQPVEKLLADHVSDYQFLFNRVSLDLGATEADMRSLPTDLRLLACRGGGKLKQMPSIYDGMIEENPELKGSVDPELEALLFRYARYLMISCSRPGDLPANLQGIWNNSIQPPWRCDYHANLNLQMNYWFVDAANIGECFEPFSEWLNSITPVRREETKRELGVRGWATRWENGVFGGATCPWSMGDAAWFAQNLWDHYAFTRDKEYLRTKAYPIFKELCEFWEDILKENADGKLVAPPGRSPEHGPIAAGNAYDQQLAYDLFTNTIEASKDLGVDSDFRAKLEKMRARLLGPKIGKWGQLQEWAEDLDNPNDAQRHVSHMVAVYPGRQINPLVTPELAEAARISMNARGDASTGWSRAWKACIWSRLHDGQRAYKILNGMIRTSFTPNLLATHPPFQIDANFCYGAAVCEMLLQSHAGEIQLLPALPREWATGSVKGLKARGNFTVDIDWKDGKVTNYRIASPEPSEVKVRVNGEARTIQSVRL